MKGIPFDIISSIPFPHLPGPPPLPCMRNYEQSDVNDPSSGNRLPEQETAYTAVSLLPSPSKSSPSHFISASSWRKSLGNFG